MEWNFMTRTKRKKQPEVEKIKFLDIHGSYGEKIEALENQLDEQDCNLRNATEIIGQLTVLCMKHGITIEIK